MKYGIFLACCLILIISACSSSKKITKADNKEIEKEYFTTDYTGPKKKLAIAKFENATRFGKRRLGENITDVLTTEMSKTGRFTLIERAEVDKILEQIALSQTGLTEGNLEQIQLLDADYILTGTVTHYAVTTTGSSNLFTQSKVQKATVGADVRIINVRTGEILLSESGKGRAEKSFDKVLGMGEDGGYDESLELDAFRAAVINLTENIVIALDKEPFVCDVVKISGSKLYIDAGKKSNLKIGTQLDLFKKENFITNLSGQIIGFEEQFIITAMVSDFFGNNGAILSFESDSSLVLPLFCRIHPTDTVKRDQ